MSVIDDDVYVATPPRAGLAWPILYYRMHWVCVGGIAIIETKRRACSLLRRDCVLVVAVLFRVRCFMMTITHDFAHGLQAGGVFCGSSVHGRWILGTDCAQRAGCVHRFADEGLKL